MVRSPGFKSQGHMGCCCRGVAFPRLQKLRDSRKSKGRSAPWAETSNVFGIADLSTEKLVVYCARTCGRLVGGETREQWPTGVSDAAPAIPSRPGLWWQSPSRLRG